MTLLQIELSDTTHEALRKRAACEGKDVPELAAELIEGNMRPLTYADVFGPIQKAMAGHGMTEEESLEFWQAQRDALWLERQASSGGHKP